MTIKWVQLKSGVYTAVIAKRRYFMHEYPLGWYFYDKYGNNGGPYDSRERTEKRLRKFLAEN